MLCDQQGSLRGHCPEEGGPAGWSPTLGGQPHPQDGQGPEPQPLVRTGHRWTVFFLTKGWREWTCALARTGQVGICGATLPSRGTALPIPPTLPSVSLPGEESGASPGTGVGSGSPEIKSLARRWPGQGSCGDGHRQDTAHSCGAWPVGCRDVKARDHGGRHDMSGRDWRKLHRKSQVRDQWAFHLGPLVLRTQYWWGREGPGSPEASLGPGQPAQRSMATSRPPGPPNWPELLSPFLAFRGRPGKFSCADHGGHLEPGHCGPRAPATSGRTRAEPRRPRPSPGPRSPSPRNASGSLGAISQSLQDSNPGFSGRLSDTSACRPRTAEQRRGPSGERGSGTPQGVHVQTWQVPGHLPSRDPEPHLGQKKGWPGLSRSRPLARAGRPACRQTSETRSLQMLPQAQSSWLDRRVPSLWSPLPIQHDLQHDCPGLH